MTAEDRYAETMSKIAVIGARGRLGSLVCEVVEDHPAFTLDARLGRSSGPDDGADADVLIDVSHPDASPGIVEGALRRGQRVIVGTSGWSEDRLAELDRLVRELPDAAAIVIPNFSLGSVIATELTRIAAPYFDSVEIVEAHHAAKVDSPSGTAVRTAELIAGARGEDPIAAPFSEQPARGQVVAGVPVHSLRLRGIIARQEVRFGGYGETLTVTHDTHSPDSYRAGIRASLEAIGSARGLTVGLDQLLGIRTS